LATVNDLELHNGHYFALFHQIQYIWGTDNYVTVVEVRT